MLTKNRYIIIFSLAFLLILLPHNSFATSFRTGGVRLSKKVKPLREIKRENVVTQSLDFSCGAAGLSTLLNYYLNDSISEQEIIETLLTMVSLEKVKERQGFSLLDLKTFAQSRGYEVTGYKMDVEFLKELNKPVLVPIVFKKYRHFVIVKAVMADRVFIADPAVGNMTMKISQFEKIWTNGIGLVVENEELNDQTREYALKVTDGDLVISNYKNLENLINRGVLQTKIHPTEW